jgi:hypothetical protein
MPARGHDIARYVELHPDPPAAAEFLTSDGRGSYYVRWPNGSMRWVSTEYLTARQIAIGPCLLDDGDDPETAALREAP